MTTKQGTFRWISGNFLIHLEFRLGIANEMYKKLTEQTIPEGYNLKIVSIPAAGTTVTTDMSLVYGVSAARLRKEAFSYLEDAEKYGKNIKDTGTLAKHYEQRASAKGRTASRGKKDLFEEGSLQNGDALWFVDNVSSRNAKSKITACTPVRDDALHKGLLEGEDYIIDGSAVIVSNSPNAQKVHEENNLKFAYLWTLPELVNEIMQSTKNTYRNTSSKGLQDKINDFNTLYPTIVDEIEELGWVRKT